MNYPLVSVLMSTYNEDIEHLEKAIDSIINQSYYNIELIIINDNPKRNDLKNFLSLCSEKDKRIKVIVNDENKGLIKSLNKGLDFCNGKYIARMDADDISDLSRIKKQVEYLQENLDVVLVGTDISYIDERDNVVNNSSFLVHGFENIKKRLNVYNCFNHPTWMFDSYILKNINGYRNVRTAEDYDFIVRLVLNGYKCDNINEKLLKYRIRSNGISQSNVLMQKIATRKVAEYYRKGIVSSNIENELSILEPNEFQIENYSKCIEVLYRFKEDKNIYNLLDLLKVYFNNKEIRVELNSKIYNKIKYKI